MNALAHTQSAPIVNYDDPILFKVLKDTLYPGAQDQSVALVLDYCRAARLDPLTKPVHIVPMWDSKQRKNRDAIIPGIGKYRADAARTAQYVGISEPEFGPMISRKYKGVIEYEDRNGRTQQKTIEAEVSFPEWCKVTVFRLVCGQRCAFVGFEYWEENCATQGKTDVPNSMWQKRPRGQIAKCAEAQALRKAFPELNGGQTAEEMEGKEFGEGEVIEGEIVGGAGKPGNPPPPPPGNVADLQERLRQRKGDGQNTGTNDKDGKPSGKKGEEQTPLPELGQGKSAKGSAGKALSLEDVLQAILGANAEEDLGPTLDKVNALSNPAEKSKAGSAYRLRLGEIRRSGKGKSVEPGQDESIPTQSTTDEGLFD